MKRRAFQVTRVSKKVDHRLHALEEKLVRIEKMVAYLEKHIFDGTKENSEAGKSTTVTYTVTSSK